ncbi:hypothetical protein AAKU67_004308 [Oxalobacteraceae bacterium GrIS 2.11]
MITINIADQFSRYPAGRYQTDGPYSGEFFRNKYLVPALKEPNNDKIVVNLDGARGYGSSFLEEAFGGLVRMGFNKETIKSKMEILAKDSSLKIEILDYIDKAIPAT